MDKEIENLWPENFDCDYDNSFFPEKILKEQCKYLENKTNAKVYAEVIENTNRYYDPKFKVISQFIKFKEDYVHSLIIGSKLDTRISYEIFTISHNYKIYPLKIRINNSQLNSQLDRYKDNFNCSKKDDGFGEYWVIQKENDFIEILKFILQSNIMKLYIHKLMGIQEQKSS
ncbi:hypothetical protein [Clostridium felsineum]|uniref:hypothetical protein n=1 Tax=Clostridium felsineum TaxID=36839 RepID=UPI00098C07D0|nr:hypothetical protein [Clostridium felsineum]URZ15791.1 hypothetical protein CLFE_018380 [Clostridium felsineum DSM 794]